MGESTTAFQVSELLARLRGGETGARESLLDIVYPTLHKLSRRMLADYADVHRWDDTSDICQQAALRLYQALESVQPESVLHFYRLAGRQIRRTLIDMARKHRGPMGLARNHDTGLSSRQAAGAAPDSEMPLTLACWAEFHEQVANLPVAARDVFELLWYAGLDQRQAAAALGVSLRSVQRHWRESRLLLSRRLQGIVLEALE